VSEFKGATRGREVDATTATAHLPGLGIEIIHRRLPDGDAEQISINLQAAPSFEAFARLAWFPWLRSRAPRCRRASLRRCHPPARTSSRAPRRMRRLQGSARLRVHRFAWRAKARGTSEPTNICSSTQRE
jgi:hypothetical protein